MMLAVLIVIATLVVIDVSFVAARIRAARKADRRRAQRRGMVRITSTPHREIHR